MSDIIVIRTGPPNPDGRRGIGALACKRNLCKQAPFCPPDGCNRPGCLVDASRAGRKP